MIELDEARSKLLSQLNIFYAGTFDIPIADMSPPDAETMNRDQYESHVAYLAEEMWIAGPSFSGKDAVVCVFEVDEEEKKQLLREWEKYYNVRSIEFHFSFRTLNLGMTFLYMVDFTLAWELIVIFIAGMLWRIKETNFMTLDGRNLNLDFTFFLKQRNITKN